MHVNGQFYRRVKGTQYPWKGDRVGPKASLDSPEKKISLSVCVAGIWTTIPRVVQPIAWSLCTNER